MNKDKHKKIVDVEEKCHGCHHAICRIYPDPEWVWTNKYCTFPTRYPEKLIEVSEKEMQDYQNEPTFKGNGDDDG